MDMIEHRVRERAYYIWEGEGHVMGRADAHWLQAEAEITAANAEAAPAAAVSVARAAKTPVTRAKAAAKAPAKASEPKAAPKAAAVRAPAKSKRAPRGAEVGIALH
jgi:hypothetical protein